MSDEHRAPGDGDRKPVRDRIASALADGRIGAADAEIRLGNVANAQSLTELSLLTRDLDQIEAAAAAATRAAEPTTTAAAPVPSYAAPVPAGSSSTGRVVPLLILGLVFSLVVAGGIALFAFSSDGGKDEIGVPPTSQEQVTPAAPVSSAPGGGTGSPEPATTPFERTASGIKAFLATYKQRFGTSKATELTMFSDYAIVRVPVPGKKRDAGWIYRDGGWSEFGGVRATTLGAKPVDLTRLDVAALIRNMAKAKRSLNVEDPEISHVAVDFRSVFDDVPNVRIYASNEFNESGYLATDLSGAVLRTYPYS